MQARFNSLGATVKVEFSLSDLSKRDKLDLLRALLSETGIENALLQNFDQEKLETVTGHAFDVYLRS